MYIGTGDFTVVTCVALVSFVALSLGEYFICLKAKKDFTKKLLFLFPACVFAGALILYVTSSHAFIDLLNFITLWILAYGLLCLVAVSLGFLLYRKTNTDR